MRFLIAVICLASSLAAADLEAGRFVAVYTVNGQTETQPFTLTRKGDMVSATPDNGEPVMQGKIVAGTIAPRLLLARHRFNQDGIWVDVIVADITEDGYASGYAHRSVNGVDRERMAIVIRKE